MSTMPLGLQVKSFLFHYCSHFGFYMDNTNVTVVDMKNQQVSGICGSLVLGGGKVSPVWSWSKSLNLCSCCLVLVLVAQTFLENLTKIWKFPTEHHSLDFLRLTCMMMSWRLPKMQNCIFQSQRNSLESVIFPSALFPNLKFCHKKFCLLFSHILQS